MPASQHGFSDAPPSVLPRRDRKTCELTQAAPLRAAARDVLCSESRRTYAIALARLLGSMLIMPIVDAVLLAWK